MRTAIDKSGRVVIPKAIRDALELGPDVPLSVVLRDGAIVLEPAPTPMRLEETRGGFAAVPETELPPLTAEQVRRALEDTRR